MVGPRFPARTEPGTGLENQCHDSADIELGCRLEDHPTTPRAGEQTTKKDFEIQYARWRVKLQLPQSKFQAMFSVAC